MNQIEAIVAMKDGLTVIGQNHKTRYWLVGEVLASKSPHGEWRGAEAIHNFIADSGFTLVEGPRAPFEGVNRVVWGDTECRWTPEAKEFFGKLARSVVAEAVAQAKEANK